MINFMCEEFSPKITCDKPCTDNHDVTNLITVSKDKSKKGFITEYFIKAPASVTITFPFNVDIHKIVIDPVVGSLKSLGFQIYSQSKAVAPSVFLNNDVKGSIDSNKANSDGIDVSVRIGTQLLNTPTVVCFTNKRYSPRKSFCSTHVQDCYHGDMVQAELRHHLKRTLSYVSHLTISITKTMESRCPALKFVEVWGQPSFACSVKVLEKVQTICGLIAQENEENEEKQKYEAIKREDFVCSDSHASLKLEIKDSGYVVNNIAIPEEFIDPITCEIMSIPILLPSGKIIDNSTLDRHIETESSWGRQGNDPFTGISFNCHHKPILNPALKNRIDNFLLIHSDKLKDVPRTLGRTLKSHETVAHDVSKDCVPKNNSLYFMNSLPVSNKRKLSDSCNVTEKRTKMMLYDHAEVVKLNDECSSSIVFSTSESTSTNHECHLKSSLTFALSNTLSKLSSFTKSIPPSATTLSNVIIKCCKCNDSDQSVYKLPCEHLCCRKCLLTEESPLMCPSCRCRYNRCDVTKLH